MKWINGVEGHAIHPRSMLLPPEFDLKFRNRFIGMDSVHAAQCCEAYIFGLLHYISFFVKREIVVTTIVKNGPHKMSPICVPPFHTFSGVASEKILWLKLKA